MAVAPVLGPEMEELGVLPVLEDMLLRPLLHDFAARVLGPSVQLDSL